MYYLSFENDVFIDENLDLRYIEDLLRIYLNKTDSYEIKILKENKSMEGPVEEFAVYSSENAYEYIFQGIIDDEFKEMLLANLIGENALKFFGISLFNDGKLLFESINYGSEIYIFGFDEHSVVDFSKELEELYGIKEINVYVEDEEDDDHNHNHEDGGHHHNHGYNH